MDPERRDVVWQQAPIAARYLADRRGIPFLEAHFEVVGQIIRAHDLEVRRVLDLGAGDGIAVAALLGDHPIDHATLVDFSRPMLDEARARLAGTDARIDFVWGDLRGSEWRAAAEASGPFDLVISRFAIHHVPDARKRTLYGEIRELLRPGGLFIHIEHVSSLSPVYERAFYESLAEGIARADPGHRSAEEIIAMYSSTEERAANILAPVDVQLDWLREVGFVDVDCLFKAFELAVFAGRKP